MKRQAAGAVIHARELVTCAGFSREPARGAKQGALGALRDGAVVFDEGVIVAVGNTDEVLRAWDPRHVVDASHHVVLPGFVDPHTHLVYAGHRADEWEARLAGKAYLDILREGGGIQRTVGATRGAGFDALLEGALRRARACLAHGTTTIEIKSGYGLDRETEMRCLEVAQALGKRLPIEIVTTYLGAHVVPLERASDRAGYLDLVEQMMGLVAERGLAEFVDVFVEDGAYAVDEARRLLSHAKTLHLGLKIHADQFGSQGAVELGIALGATSVDHLEHTNEATIEALAKAETCPVAVLLPGVPFHLALDRYAPARALIEAGVPVALATDHNPGSSPSVSMPMMLQIACRAMRMSVSEALVAATINAAHAIRRAHAVGSLEVGKRADVLLCEGDDHRLLAYEFGANPVSRVIARGVVAER